MNTKCDLCGREMVERNDTGAFHIRRWFECPATPDQHKIATLEKRVAQLLAAAEERTRQINQLKEKLRNPEKRFIDLQYQLRAREEEVLALRCVGESLSDMLHHLRPLLPKNDLTGDKELCDVLAAWMVVLRNTSATAQEIVARIEREALQMGWERFSALEREQKELGIRYTYKQALAQARAAILGEKNP